jgi:4-hydroxy 2-oxovalerate aldolase
MKVLQEQLLPLQKTTEWGPYPQYNLTGHYNLHPRLAIKARSGPDRDNFLGFIEQILTDI